MNILASLAMSVWALSGFAEKMEYHIELLKFDKIAVYLYMYTRSHCSFVLLGSIVMHCNKKCFYTSEAVLGLLHILAEEGGDRSTQELAIPR
jgi:hypothetical protein